MIKLYLNSSANIALINPSYIIPEIGHPINIVSFSNVTNQVLCSVSSFLSAQIIENIMFMRMLCR